MKPFSHPVSSKPAGSKHLYVLLLLLTCIAWCWYSGSLSAHERTVLRVAGWDVYADPENKTKTIGYRGFEEKFGVTIEFTPLHNLDDIVDAAESGADFDVFVISNEGIQLLHDMGLVVALDLGLLPNYQDLHHALRYSEWSLFDGQVYAVPWAWGPTGLLYDSEAMPEPDSWNVLWDPAFRGRVALWDDVSMIWVTALALGYNNVYSLTRDQLAAVEKKLLELNQQVFGYYHGEQQALEFISENRVILMNSWFDPSQRLRKQGMKFTMVIPKEGAVGMFDSYLVSRDTHHNELALQYINHQISPSVQQEMLRITGLVPANMETLLLLSQAEIKALHLDQPDYFNRMLLWDHMPRKHLYQEILDKVRGQLAVTKH